MKTPTTIIPLPGRRRRSHAKTADPFSEYLQANKAIFESAAGAGREVMMPIPAGLFGALLTEATNYRLSMQHITREMIRIGLDRFDAEGLVWTNRQEIPSNVIPLRRIKDVVKHHDCDFAS
jgi:hypothetical protein